MDSVWYVKVKGKKYGPFTPEKLNELVEAGKLTVDTPTLATGASVWTTVGTVRRPMTAAPIVPEAAPPSKRESADAPEISPAQSRHRGPVILLGSASAGGVIIYWLDLYLPTLKLSLSVITAAAVALILRYLASVAFNAPSSGEADTEASGTVRRELFALFALGGGAGALLGGINLHESAALAAVSVETRKQPDPLVITPAKEEPKAEKQREELPARPRRPSGPTAAQLAEQKRQEENAQALDVLGAILQGAANDHARVSQGVPCAACGGTGSYSYVDSSGRLQVSGCPHCSGSGKKWGGGGLFGR